MESILINTIYKGWWVVNENLEGGYSFPYFINDSSYKFIWKLEVLLLYLYFKFVYGYEL